MPQITLNTSMNKVKKFITGKGITVYGDESGDQKLDLDFEELKDYNRMVKNFKGNKGFVLKGSQMREAKHNGGDILGDLKRGWNKFVKNPTVRKIGRKAIKVLAPMAGEALGTAAGTFFGAPEIGLVAGKLAGDYVADKYGEGVMQDMGRKMSATMKLAGRKARPMIKTGLTMAKKEFAVHKPVLKDIAKNIIMKELNNSSTVDKIVNTLNDKAGVPVGDYAKGYVSSRINEALSDPVIGSGIKRGRGRPRKVLVPPPTESEVLKESMHQGLGGDRFAQSDIKRRMEIVRSYRRKSVDGGSFLANI